MNYTSNKFWNVGVKLIEFIVVSIIILGIIYGSCLIAEVLFRIIS